MCPFAHKVENPGRKEKKRAFFRDMNSDDDNRLFTMREQTKKKF